jgi:hypothetical protein
MAEYTSIKEIQDMQSDKGEHPVTECEGRFIGLFKKDGDWAHIFECVSPTGKTYECVIGITVIVWLILCESGLLDGFDPVHITPAYMVCKNILTYMQEKKLHFDVTFYKVQNKRIKTRVTERTIERLHVIREEPVVKSWLDCLIKHKVPMILRAPIATTSVAAPAANPSSQTRSDSISTEGKLPAGSLSPANQTLSPTHLSPKDQRHDSLQKKLSALR